MAYTSKYTGEQIEELLGKIENFDPESGGGGDVTPVPLYAEVTYEELKVLRDNKQLEAGMKYRITDFVSETSMTGTRSANHPFDLIVTALSSDSLSEIASAIRHDGDTHFENADLGAWTVYYCLDNDKQRFPWAKADVPASPQKWSCDWGILESRLDNNASTNYKTVAVDGRTYYLYRPDDPSSHLEDYTFEARSGEAIVIDSTEGFIYKSDSAPYYDEWEEYWYWDGVSSIEVYTADGHYVTTLSADYDGVFVDTSDEMWEYPISFSPTPKETEDGGYEYSPNQDEVNSWWDGVYGGSIELFDSERIDGSDSSLYYAFDSVLDRYGVYVSCVYSDRTEKLYYYYEGDESYDFDYVNYSPYTEAVRGGTGVIYRLIDEYENDLPYDFKGIQIQYGESWYYPFHNEASATNSDLSLSGKCAHNRVNPYRKVAASDQPTMSAIPQVIFCITGTAPYGVFYNEVLNPIQSGLIKAGRNIAGNRWLPVNEYSPILSLYAILPNREAAGGAFCGNTFIGGAKKITITSSSDSATFMMNTVKLNNGTSYEFNFIGPAFNRNLFDFSIARSSADIDCGAIQDCVVVDYGVVSSGAKGGVKFNGTLSHSNIKMFDLLTISYGNTTSSNSPLRFLDIDARGWSATTLTIPTTFKANASYEWKVAKDSNGNIKQWCEADMLNQVSAIETKLKEYHPEE